MQASESTAFGDAAARPRRRRLVRNGVVGNSRITGGTAVVLLVLLAAEGLTIPLIGQLTEAHVFIGMLLLGPVALKLASTGYRFVRYYGGTPAYVRKGPPPITLRLLGPVVVISTVMLFATGVGLLIAGPPSNTLKLAHKAFFIIWFGAMAIHVLAHLLELPSLAVPDWRRYGGREARLAGSGPRVLLLVGSLVVGLILAVATIGGAGAWAALHVGGGG